MRITMLATMLSLTALAGCRDTTAPGDSAPIGVLSPLALSTTLSSTTLPPGGSVEITITVTNISNAAVTVTDYACNTRFALTTMMGVTVVPYRDIAACDAVLNVRTLAPHASVSFTESWDGRVLLSGGTVGRVPAGEYTVRGNGVFGPVRRNAGAQLTIGG